VAIIGASPRNVKALSVLKNLRDSTFSGDIYPVNPNYQEVDGLRCYPSVEAIDVPPDLAVLLVPADAVPLAAASCVRAGVGAAVIMSAGFGEDERGSGKERDTALRAALDGSDMVVCGPNSEGFVNVSRGITLSFSGSVNSTFLREAVSWAGPDADLQQSVQGGVAIVAQSGGLGFSVFGRGVEIGVGFSHVVSVGNELDLDVLECAEYLLAQPDVQVVAMYVEGFRRPERLRALAEAARVAGKSIVIGKAGGSESGSKAAMSHTGHLAGEARVNEVVFDSLGIVSVADQQEMLDVCAALAVCPPAAGDRVGVVSWSGGSAVWTADACERYGLQLPELDNAMREKLSAVLPEFANIRNPIDLTGAAKSTPGKILRSVADAANLDSFVLIVPLNHPGVLDGDRQDLSDLLAETGKAVVVYSYTTPHPGSRVTCRKLGIPIYESSTRAARALAALHFVAGRQAPQVAVDVAVPRGDDRQLFSERATTELLRIAGLPTTRQELAVDAEQAVAAAERMDGPVALKLQAPSMPHKKLAGGLLLAVQGNDAVHAGYRELMDLASAYPDVEGVLVQEMVPPGLEMLVGIDNNSGFGPMVMVGFGGSGVEELSDSSLRCAPVTAEQALDMIRGLRHGALLTEPLSVFPKYSLDALIDFVVRLSTYAVDHSAQLWELDINPLIVTEQGVRIIDSMMVGVAP
jgi:acyl-CoA synthetase (NDP forming)